MKRQKKILIVERHDVVRDLLKEGVVRFSGYEEKNVIAVGSGVEGFKALHNNDIDLVITCLGLEIPGQAYALARQAGDIPVILITGAPDEIDKRSFVHVIYKPFDIALVVQVIIETIGY